MLKKGIKGELYNIGMQKEIEINRLIKDISNSLEINIEVKSTNLLQGSTTRRCPDTTKIKSIGYNENNNYYKGLEKTINWYINNIKKKHN